MSPNFKFKTMGVILGEVNCNSETCINCLKKRLIFEFSIIACVRNLDVITDQFGTVGMSLEDKVLLIFCT